MLPSAPLTLVKGGMELKSIQRMMRWLDWDRGECGGGRRCGGGGLLRDGWLVKGGMINDPDGLLFGRVFRNEMDLCSLKTDCLLKDSVSEVCGTACEAGILFTLLLCCADKWQLVPPPLRNPFIFLKSLIPYAPIPPTLLIPFSLYILFSVHFNFSRHRGPSSPRLLSPPFFLAWKWKSGAKK